jgi:hypothetical protein
MTEFGCDFVGGRGRLVFEHGGPSQAQEVQAAFDAEELEAEVQAGMNHGIVYKYTQNAMGMDQRNLVGKIVIEEGMPSGILRITAVYP